MASYNKFTKIGSGYYSSKEDFAQEIFGYPRYVEKNRLLEILRLDYNIRLLAQREESLDRKARAWKKTIDIGNNIEQLPVGFDFEIRSAQAQRIKEEYTMFRLISELPSWVTAHFDSLRRDHLWYMRKEMVHDCAGRGGCCSRGCGCCARRSLPEKTKSRGHCTTECWCCRSFRDPSLTEDDLTSIALEMDRLIENPKYLETMANCYFRPLRLKYKFSRGVGNVKSGLKRMFI